MLKLFMTTISMAFDFVFLMQHYVMYKVAVSNDTKKKLYELKKERR